MNTVKVLGFRFHPATGPFNPQTKVLVDWNGNDSAVLSQNLIYQINNNHIDLQSYIQSCGVSTSTQCIKFLQNSSSYREVHGLDVRAIYQNGFNVELNAIVVIYNNEYYGHIYAWVSPIDRNICFFQGIRNRVDNLFLGEKKLSNVSNYLLEGVRNVALIKGCNQIIVANPRPIMREILSKLSFQPINIPIRYAGFSINLKKVPTEEIMETEMYQKFPCLFCSVYNNLGVGFANVDFRYFS